MEKIFGLSERALQLSEDRAVLLTQNLVNSSTPHYKSKDIDFSKTLKEANKTYGLKATNTRHLAGSSPLSGERLMYRVPMQNSLDGNTVDTEIERKNFIENALRYQVSLTFVQNKSEQLLAAIKGE